MSTPIIFRKQQGEVIAWFPYEPGDYNPVTCISYAHNGQHGIGNYYACLPDSTPATEAEYTPLLKELLSLGYEDLRILKRCPAYAYDRRREELKRIANS